tara:strand:+ start:224 stop:2527 length:2304 start_codon:yes stop_codon:yes gene_type:complete
MSGISRKVTMGAGGQKLAVEDVFKTWRFTGYTGVDYPIKLGETTTTSGIDLQNKGGMVILKNLDTTNSRGTMIFDTVRGVNKLLRADTSDAQVTVSNSLSAFSTTGFTVNTDNLMTSGNSEGNRFSAYVFRKAPKFFDVVTYQGNDGSNPFAHNLEQKPGMVWIKNLDSDSTDWVVWHKGIHNDYLANDHLTLNSAGDSGSLVSNWMPQTTATQFGVYGTNSRINQNGINYIAYLFGDDDSEDGMIRCVKMGAYDSSNTDTLNSNYYDFGWKAQFVLAKAYKFGDSNRHWMVGDKLRGLTANFNNSGGDQQDSYGSNVYSLDENTIERKLDGTLLTSSGEGKIHSFGGTSNTLFGKEIYRHEFGFSNSNFGSNPDKYSAVYMHIRDEPMRVPDRSRCYGNFNFDGNTNTWDAATYSMDSYGRNNGGGSWTTFNKNYDTFDATSEEGWPPDFWINGYLVGGGAGINRFGARYLWTERGSAVRSDPTYLSINSPWNSGLVNGSWSQNSGLDPDQYFADHPRGFGFEEDIHTLQAVHNETWSWKETPEVCSIKYYRALSGATSSNAYMIPHRLGAVPELILYKHTNDIYTAGKDWLVYHKDLEVTSSTNAKQVFLSNDTTFNIQWNPYTLPTATNFCIGGNMIDYNGVSGSDFIAVLFASKSGYCDIGNFDHTTGSNTTVSLNFGANYHPRFLVVKRVTDGSSIADGHWMTFGQYLNPSNYYGTRGLTLNGGDGLTSASTNYFTSTIPSGGGFTFHADQSTGKYIYWAMA